MNHIIQKINQNTLLSFLTRHGETYLELPSADLYLSAAGRTITADMYLMEEEGIRVIRLKSEHEKELLRKLNEFVSVSYCEICGRPHAGALSICADCKAKAQRRGKGSKSVTDFSDWIRRRCPERLPGTTCAQ